MYSVTMLPDTDIGKGMVFEGRRFLPLAFSKGADILKRFLLFLRIAHIIT